METIIIVLIVIGFFVIILRNKFVHLKKSMEKSKSIIDIYLKKRYDLIPNLIEVTKKYGNYEQETLLKLTAIRDNFSTANEMGKDVMEREYNTFIARVESYPQLKADVLYLNLQAELSEIEGEIAAARKIYVMDATDYNMLVSKFPSSIVASIFKYQTVKYDTFKIEEIKAEENKIDSTSTDNTTNKEQ